MGLADPDQLEQLAGQLDARAEEVRATIRSFTTQVADVAWESAGAEQYRSYCASLRDDLEHNAEEIEQAADALRKHAQAVRSRLDWMGDMVDKLRQEAAEAWDDTQGAFEWGKDKAEDAWDTVTGWL